MHKPRTIRADSSIASDQSIKRQQLLEQLKECHIPLLIEIDQSDASRLGIEESNGEIGDSMAKPSFMENVGRLEVEVENLESELGEPKVESIETDDDYDGGVGDDTDLMGEVDSMGGDRRDDMKRFYERGVEKPAEDLFEFVDDPGLGDQGIPVGFGAEDSERGAGEEEPEESDLESIDSEGNTRGQEL
jgi:hypothetical protein